MLRGFLLSSFPSAEVGRVKCLVGGASAAIPNLQQTTGSIRGNIVNPSCPSTDRVSRCRGQAKCEGLQVLAHTVSYVWLKSPLNYSLLSLFRALNATSVPLGSVACNIVGCATLPTQICALRRAPRNGTLCLCSVL